MDDLQSPRRIPGDQRFVKKLTSTKNPFARRHRFCKDLLFHVPLGKRKDREKQHQKKQPSIHVPKIIFHPGTPACAQGNTPNFMVQQQIPMCTEAGPKFPLTVKRFRVHSLLPPKRKSKTTGLSKESSNTKQPFDASFLHLVYSF